MFRKDAVINYLDFSQSFCKVPECNNSTKSCVVVILES